MVKVVTKGQQRQIFLYTDGVFFTHNIFYSNIICYKRIFSYKSVPPNFHGYSFITQEA
jgi:hypothetical protein